MVDFHLLGLQLKINHIVFDILVLSLTDNMSVSTSTDGLQVELLILNVIILREQKNTFV
jgi:hypothetical protein